MIAHLIASLHHPASLTFLSDPMTPPELANIIRNIPTFATTLPLFPNQSNFRDVPHFITTFFKDLAIDYQPS
jgi:hypothetical protein